MAEIKITGYPAIDAPVGADLLEIVDDVAGTPTSKKVTVTQLKAFIDPVTAVLGTSPVASSGGTTPAISIPAATNIAAGHATAAHITAIEANTAKTGVTTQISNLVEDTTPQLGGDLDTNGKNINAINQTNAIENESKLLQTEDIFSDFVVAGLLPATSLTLISDISAGHAYVTGTRVNKAATSKTYTASVDTYVDISSAGVYTFPEVALGTAAPAVTADSIRLAKVVTDATAITGVTDLRTVGTPMVTAAAALTANELIAGDDGAKGVKALAQGTEALQVINLKPYVNAAVNTLDVFSKSGGAAFDATNYLTVSIPDGNGYTSRTRAAAVASGTGQIILADAVNYWSRGSLNDEFKTAYLYAIWSAADGGIVFALNGYSGFTRCPASVTVTDDDYMHLEADSTYTPVVTDYCVAIAKIRYQYDTADAPDHTIQATVLDAPQVMWNPKSDYGYSKGLATGITSAADIAEASILTVVVKQSRKYSISAFSQVVGAPANNMLIVLKTGSATYGSAVLKATAVSISQLSQTSLSIPNVQVYLNAGDTIHLGAAVAAASGNRSIVGDSDVVGRTFLSFNVVD